MISKFFALVAAGVSVATASVCDYPPPLSNQLINTNSVTQPNTGAPATIGSPFDIVYDGSGLGSSLTLILLRGPSENIQFLEYITQGTANTGSYKWTPHCGLEADTTHYGIMLLDDATCKFQWSSQFGLNAGACSSSSSTASVPSTKTSKAPTSSATKPPNTSSKPHSTIPTSTKEPHSPSTTDCEEEGPTAHSKPPTWSSVYGGSGGYGPGLWSPPSNATTSTSYATGTGSYPSSTYKPLQANGAATLGMSLFGAAGALVAAVMLA